MSSSSGIAFLPGLRFSARLFTQLQNAWRSLTRRIHYSTVGAIPSNIEPTQQCEVAGRLAFNFFKADKVVPVAGRVVANLVWPRILANKPQEPVGSRCHLNFHFGRTEGLSQLRIQNLVTGPVTCRLTLLNPTTKPLFIQPILLDDLLPSSMNYTEMVEQMSNLSEELFRAAHVPQQLVAFPWVCRRGQGIFTPLRVALGLTHDFKCSKSVVCVCVCVCVLTEPFIN